MKNYRDLMVWQKSMALARDVYQVVKLLPRDELFGLSDQIRRAVVSIPSNIAEGCARESEREFLHYLSIAQGSTAELETQLLLCEDFGYIEQNATQPVLQSCEEVSKMLHALSSKLKASLGSVVKVTKANS